jgi:uncharacterized protein YndB with AHSA1/START domain
MPRPALFLVLLLAAAPAIAADPVTTSKVEADGTTTLAHEALIDAPIADVWTAISTPQGWMSWAVPIAWLSTDDPNILETSYDPGDKPGSPSTIQQRFTARIPGRLLAFRTIKAPQGFPHWETYREVSSVFELEPVGKQTRIRLTSIGYPPNEAGRTLIGFFTQGNSETLANLQKRFRDGPVDWRAKR